MLSTDTLTVLPVRSEHPPEHATGKSDVATVTKEHDVTIAPQANGTTLSQVAQTDDLIELSNIISLATQKYIERLDALGHARPDMQTNFPDPVLDDAALTAKVDIIRACEKTMALVLGPVEWLMHQNMSFTDPACVGTALRMGLFEHITPGDEPTSLEQLAEKTGADPDIIERVLRVCTQRFCFEEVSRGMYRQNAVSLQATVPPIANLIGFCTDDGFKAAAYMADTLEAQKYQLVADPTKTAFGKAYNTELGMFDFFQQVEKWRGDRFAFAMAGGEMVKALTEDIYPFENLPEGARVVDVGGGLGTVSTRIAEKVPHLNFTVQDQPGVVEIALDSGLDADLKDRITFQGHNFFESQPVQGADVYLFRFILHDHADERCATILKQIVKAMDPAKSRILIDDAIVPDVLGSDQLRFFNLMDIHMLTILNAKERTKKQWNNLVKAVDPRLEIENVWEQKDGGLNGGRVLELRLH